MTELLPCPFCGGTDIKTLAHLDWVACDDCGASLEDCEPSARELWNTRHSASSTAGGEVRSEVRTVTAPGEILERFKGGYLSIAEAIDALEQVFCDSTNPDNPNDWAAMLEQRIASDGGSYNTKLVITDINCRDVPAIPPATREIPADLSDCGDPDCGCAVGLTCPKAPTVTSTHHSTEAK